MICNCLTKKHSVRNFTDTEIKKCIITVVGKDKVGIIAGVCQYLSDISVNILNISQTIVEGYFNMMMIVDVTNCTKEIAVVVNEMEELGKTIGVDIHCQREDIFEKMHRL